MRIHDGFTLVELLVVISIIVVLLALLSPALDQAIYQAELAVCGSRLHGVGLGALTYAVDQKRAYPVRHLFTPVAQPHRLAAAVAPSQAPDLADDRPTLKGYIGLKLLLDPLTQAIELENTVPRSEVYAAYAMWYGWRYTDAGNGGRAYPGMNRIGDRFEWRGSRFNLLAGDYDENRGQALHVLSSHPDRDGTMSPQVLENDPSLIIGDTGGGPTNFLTNANAYLTRWVRLELARGPLDLNFVFDDGSVHRVDGVGIKDPRLTPAPQFSNGFRFEVGDHEWRTYLPPAN